MIHWQRTRFKKPEGNNLIIILENGECLLDDQQTKAFAWACLSTMITWIVGTAPPRRKCLLLLQDGSHHLGSPEFGMRILGWTLLTPPVIPKVTGYASGERNPKARLSDADCDKMRMLYEAGDTSYAQLGEQFGCSKSTARDIIKCRTRYVDWNRL